MKIFTHPNQIKKAIFFFNWIKFNLFQSFLYFSLFFSFFFLLFFTSFVSPRFLCDCGCFFFIFLHFYLFLWLWLWLLKDLVYELHNRFFPYCFWFFMEWYIYIYLTSIFFFKLKEKWNISCIVIKPNSAQLLQPKISDLGPWPVSVDI